MQRPKSQIEVQALIRLADMDRLGYGLPNPNYCRARELYEEALKIPGIHAYHKSYIHLELTNMDRLGQGLSQLSTDLDWARKRYEYALL